MAEHLRGRLTCLSQLSRMNAPTPLMPEQSRGYSLCHSPLSLTRPLRAARGRWRTVAWTFDLPQPSVTKTGPQGYAVNGGDITWTFTLPSPTITHVPAPIAHAVDAGTITWAFALPAPTVRHSTGTSISQFFVKVNGIWRTTSVSVKVNGAWRESKVYRKANGVWVQVNGPL